METTIKSATAKTLTNVQKTATISLFWENAERNRYGIISILIILIGCLGGLCSAFGSNANTLQLSLIVFPSIMALSLILSVAPMRAIVYVSFIAFILDLLVLIF